MSTTSHHVNEVRWTRALSASGMKPNSTLLAGGPLRAAGRGVVGGSSGTAAGGQDRIRDAGDLGHGLDAMDPDDMGAGQDARRHRRGGAPFPVAGRAIAKPDPQERLAGRPDQERAV